MADLNEIKDINADLPLTKFPDEIDDLENFSDADDEINSAIIKYNTLIKQGETAKAEEIYKQYSLKKYIISAHILNKIQQMIIACERAISSVKKYFTFSTEAPTSTTAQPNGYIWGKILSVGNGFKKVLFKLKDNGEYVDIYPKTTADNVLIDEGETETVKDKLGDLDTNIKDLSDNKLNRVNPIGTGSLGMNLHQAILGENYAVSLGSENSSTGNNSIALGSLCTVSGDNAIGEGLGLIASVNNQHVSGKYNEEGNFAQIIGNGTSVTDRKNIYTVDWDGNVKANSLVANSDIIYEGNKSLMNLSRKVYTNSDEISGLSDVVSAHTTSINSLNNVKEKLNGNYIITNIQTRTDESDSTIEKDGFLEFTCSIQYESDEGALCIPYAMSRYTNVENITYDTTLKCFVIRVQNISETFHKVLVRYAIIRYKKVA